MMRNKKHNKTDWKKQVAITCFLCHKRKENDMCKTDSFGIYVHIPFCVQKCRYCDFLSFADKSRMKEYVEAVLREIRAWHGCGEVSTIYFGGGTPSVLPAIYIEETASGYGVETQFILDWSEESSQDLCMEKTVDFTISDDSDFMDALDEAFAQWTEEELSYERLLQEYGADGIATCMFVNAPGRSYAIVYDGEDNVMESLVMFARNDKGTEEEPAVYAHEILHVFGAHDLYRGEEYSRAVTDYIAASYPDEIMRSVAGEGKISEQISRITAYHLGWIDEIPETESFPELIR